MHQGPTHKSRYTECTRRESGEEPGTHRNRGKFPEQNTNGLCSKIKILPYWSLWFIGIPSGRTIDYISLLPACIAPSSTMRDGPHRGDWWLQILCIPLFDALCNRSYSSNSRSQTRQQQFSILVSGENVRTFFWVPLVLRIFSLRESIITAKSIALFNIYVCKIYCQHKIIL